jgi:hypothetical protein
MQLKNIDPYAASQLLSRWHRTEKMRVSYILRYRSNRLLVIFVHRQRSEIEQEQEKQQNKQSNNAKG